MPEYTNPQDKFAEFSEFYAALAEAWTLDSGAKFVLSILSHLTLQGTKLCHVTAEYLQRITKLPRPELQSNLRNLRRHRFIGIEHCEGQRFYRTAPPQTWANEDDRKELFPDDKQRNPSLKLRFQAFTRDGFACHYCGRKPPEVKLHCDHRQPVSQGGLTTLENLITSCQDCNLGKGAAVVQ